MSQKGVIRRKPKYRVEGYLNLKEEIVIQARLDAQIRGWMMQDKQNNITHISKPKEHVTPKQHEVILIDPDAYACIDLDAYRMQRTRSNLLNTYLIEELAFFMSIIDIFMIIFLQIYMNWTTPYSFLRGYSIAVMLALQFHVFYCISIYMMEKHKGYQMNAQEQVWANG